jgi:hypothetical protein
MPLLVSQWPPGREAACRPARGELNRTRDHLQVCAHADGGPKADIIPVNQVLGLFAVPIATLYIFPGSAGTACPGLHMLPPHPTPSTASTPVLARTTKPTALLGSVDGCQQPPNPP